MSQEMLKRRKTPEFTGELPPSTGRTPGRVSCYEELMSSPERPDASQAPAAQPDASGTPKSSQAIEFAHTRGTYCVHSRGAQVDQKWIQEPTILRPPCHPQEDRPSENRATPALALDTVTGDSYSFPGQLQVVRA